MRHLTKKEMQKLEPFTADDFSLQFDWPRRLHNALRALADLDPHPIDWLEKNTDPHHMTVQRVTRLVECRARALLLKRYHYFGHDQIGSLIFRDWPFTDRGNLSPG